MEQIKNDAKKLGECPAKKSNVISSSQATKQVFRTISTVVKFYI
jgi:hypothetical protein